MAESAFAEHILSSIRKELELLKNNNYIQPKTYNEILHLLPQNASRQVNSVYPPSVQSPTQNNFATGMPSPINPVVTHQTTLPPPPSYQATNDNKLGKAEALYDFAGENPSTDLTLRRGDIIQILEFINSDWWKGTVNGKTGIFPSNYVKKIEATGNEKVSAPPTPARRDNYGGYAPPNNYAPPAQTTYTQPSTYPPPAQSYAPPPANNSYGQSNSYAPPPIQNQVSSYSAPPTQQVATTSTTEGEHSESKVAGFGKKFAGNVANAATWGFGATIGSNVANSIF